MSGGNKRVVLAENPLDQVLGGGLRSVPRRAGPTAIAAVATEVATSETSRESEPGRAIELPAEEGRARAAEPAEPALVGEAAEPHSGPDTNSISIRDEVRLPKTRRERRGREATASLRHRVGTMKAPYERQDGVRVRQWAITLPIDIVRRMNHRAIDEGVKPAELALQAFEQFLASLPPRSNRR